MSGPAPGARLAPWCLSLLCIAATAAAAQGQGRVATINGESLHHEVTGEGAPLVLIHGWSLSLGMWDPQVPELSRRFRVIRYDRRGFGESSGGEVAWSQAEPRSGHFRTSDGVELHYLEAGAGPTIVLVPGWTMPAEIWEPQLRHFAATHRVVAFDPRGHGRSAKPTYGYHPTRRALDIRELLTHLGEPAVVVGWSLGVQEILVSAQEFGTDAIRAIVLVDHPITLDPAETTALVASRVQNILVDRPAFTRALMQAIHATPQPDAYLDRLTQAVLEMPDNAAALVSANVALLGPVDLRPALGAVDRPVLFVFSALDWAMAAADEVRRHSPDVQVEVIGGTSHALFVDRPEEFNRVLEAFLASLPE